MVDEGFFCAVNIMEDPFPHFPLFILKQKKLNLLSEYSFMNPIAIIFKQKPIIKNPFAENKHEFFSAR